MQFCPAAGCEAAMVRETRGGSVSFRCGTCGTIVPGTPNDARIWGRNFSGAATTASMYQSLRENAAVDPTAAQVNRVCATCGRDYATQVRLGAAEVFRYICRCGREESAHGDVIREGNPDAGFNVASE